MILVFREPTNIEPNGVKYGVSHICIVEGRKDEIRLSFVVLLKYVFFSIDFDVFKS